MKVNLTVLKIPGHFTAKVQTRVISSQCVVDIRIQDQPGDVILSRVERC